MKKICAWCGTWLVKDGEVDVRKTDTVVSHGICKNCLKTVRFQDGVKLQELLDNLEAPVVAVDSDVVLKIVNEKARLLFGKTPEAIIGHRGGDVFECAYARLPGGCGKTVHCSGCAIRRTVTETYNTGKPFNRVSATLDRGSKVREDATPLFISTEKIGDLVFLRIDRE